MQEKIPSETMPDGVVNAYWFQGFNATSWSIILGTPMLLYLKTLGASATVLGITVSLIPLFSVLQIPAANIADRMGYKTFVVRGWTSRSIFILGIAIVALWPEMTDKVRTFLLLVMLGLFAMVRGISLCGYLPWITGIIPESLRGAFLSRDTMFMNLAFAATMLFSSAWVGMCKSQAAFGILFLFSYIAALIAVFFLRRVPDIQEAKNRSSGQRPPWKEMILYPPFFKYVSFSVVFNIFVAAISVIWVPFMRDSYNASSSLILGLSAYSCTVAAIASRLTGPLADRVGSRPLLGLSSWLVITGQCLWMSLAAGIIPHRTYILFIIISFGATGFSVMGVACLRLLMGLIPVTGRSHFFAISNVATSLTLGLLPIIWGLAFDGTGRILADNKVASGWAWNRYSVFYAIIVFGLLIAQYFRHRLDEPKAMSTEEFMHVFFVKSPARLVERVMQALRRLLPPGNPG